MRTLSLRPNQHYKSNLDVKIFIIFRCDTSLGIGVQVTQAGLLKTN